MNNSKFYGFILILTLFSLSFITSCKDDEVTPTGTGTVSVEFDNLANGNTLLLGESAVNENGDTMSFVKFDYYVSNFSLVKSDGSIYTVPKDSCYFLIKEEGGENTEIELNNIPVGDYKELRFIVGVDSAKSVSPLSERTGVLNPNGEGSGMYWSSNNGYIFCKAEGISPSAPWDSFTNLNFFRYHIGSYGGSSSVNNIKSISLNNGDVATVRTNISPNFHVTVEIMEMFKSPTTIKVADYPSVMDTPFSANIASNYQDMFELHHIHN